MDEKDKEKLELTPEEQKAEEEATKEVNETDLKAKIAEDMELDPEIDADLVEKLVKREKEHREKLSGAIKQKISWRDKAKKASEKPGGQKNDKDNVDMEKFFEQKFNERMEARDIESISVPNDEIKVEIKELAKMRGISVREAAKLPYIISRIEEAEKAKRILEATPKRNDKGVKVYVDPSKPLDPKDFRLDTPEGVKEWRAAQAARRNHERNS